jgi:hypothetical protein
MKRIWVIYFSPETNLFPQNKEPNLIGLLCHLKFKYHAEKYAAIQKFRIHDFDKIWMKWEAIFEI